MTVPSVGERMSNHETLSTDRASASPYRNLYHEWIRNHDKHSDRHDDHKSSSEEGSSVISEILFIVRWRLRAYSSMRRYDELKAEVLRFKLLSSNWNTSILPQWVPFSLLLEGMVSRMHAVVGSDLLQEGGEQDAEGGQSRSQIQQYREWDKALDEFYQLRMTIVEKDDLFKLDACLSNVLMQREEWRLALKTLDDMLEYVEEAVRLRLAKLNGGEDHWSEKILVKAIKIELYSRQGKIMLQAGCLPAAATVFERAYDVHLTMNPEELDVDVEGVEMRGFGGGKKDFEVVRNVPVRVIVNEGLLHFAHADYDLAEQKFAKAIEMQRLQHRRLGQQPAHATNSTSTSNITTTSLCMCMEEDGLIDTEDDLLMSCTNNLALCALYTCRMRQAVNIMESLIRENPTKYLTGCLAFNLCTLYELGYDNATSEKMKRVLKAVAIRFTLHDIDHENFRLADGR